MKVFVHGSIIIFSGAKPFALMCSILKGMGASDDTRLFIFLLTGSVKFHVRHVLGKREVLHFLWTRYR